MSSFEIKELKPIMKHTGKESHHEKTADLLVHTVSYSDNLSSHVAGMKPSIQHDPRLVLF